jgi:hypothetical protein
VPILVVDGASGRAFERYTSPNSGRRDADLGA